VTRFWTKGVVCYGGWAGMNADFALSMHLKKLIDRVDQKFRMTYHGVIMKDVIFCFDLKFKRVCDARRNISNQCKNNYKNMHYGSLKQIPDMSQGLL
jgi:hypothetical protein